MSKRSAAAAFGDVLAPDSRIVKTETYDRDAVRWVLALATKEDLGLTWARRTDDEFEATKRSIAAWHRGGGRVEYALSKAGAAHLAGRLNAVKGRGLQCFSRALRGLFASKFYWDIDMVNAQPTLLLQLAEKHGWACDALRHFVQHRDELLASIMALGYTRDEAKGLCIALVFGQGAAKTKAAGLPPFFTARLQPELATLRANIGTCADFADLRRTLKRVKGADGVALTLAAYVAQTEERKCLMALERALLAGGRALDVYIHDGGLAPRLKDEEAFPPALLRACEAAILKNTGYTVQLTVKPMSASVVIPEGAMESLSLPRALEAFEARHQLAYVQTRDRYAYFNATTRSVELVPKPHLLNLFESDRIHSVDGKGKPCTVAVIKNWLEWKDRAVYGDAGFWPSRDAAHAREGVLNTFCGYAYEPLLEDTSLVAAAADSDDVKLVDQHVVWICGGTAEAAYFHKVLAAKLQRPLQPPRLNLAFNGGCGIGKDTVIKWVGGAVLGRRVFASSKEPQRDFFGPFNSPLEYAVMAHIEDADAASFFGAHAKFKPMITAEHAVINAKGEKQREVDSYALWCVSMNRPGGLPIEADDRRTVLFGGVDHAHKQDPAYFAALHTALARPAVIKHYAQRWLATDLSGFDAVRDRPISHLHKMACAAAIPVELEFLVARLEEGPLPPFIPYATLYKDFSDWHTAQHAKPPYDSPRKLVSKLKEATGKGGARLAGEKEDGTFPLQGGREYADTGKQERGFHADDAAVRAWLQGKGYLAAPRPAVEGLREVAEAVEEADNVPEGLQEDDAEATDTTEHGQRAPDARKVTTLRADAKGHEDASTPDPGDDVPARARRESADVTEPSVGVQDFEDTARLQLPQLRQTNSPCSVAEDG